MQMLYFVLRTVLVENTLQLTVDFQSTVLHSTVTLAQQKQEG